ncbi:cyclic nucleotide-binding domain-containing protein [Myroides fluvii]|uniref:hypothetical protein n=1 Tax=Myroides fluvii TaxID=2572594 RepID=UPI001E5D35D1|nr:hypothetical protein [Myroides fluvii]
MEHMEQMDIFENYLFSIGGLQVEEIKITSQFFEAVSLKKGDFFIQENEICRYIGCIAHGAVKAYGSDKEGKENITCFKFENELQININF